MKDLLGGLSRAFSRRKPADLPDLSKLRLENPVGRVVVSGLGPRGVGAWKADPDFFYPPFAFELYLRGIELVFATTMRDLVRACETPLELVIVHVYNEDFEDFSELFGFDRSLPDALIFNRADTGAILGWKDKTHARLTACGIAMPRLADGLEAGIPVFSNAVRGSKSPMFVVHDRAALDRTRYNTEFIDTRQSFRGIEYNTSVRMLCVGREIVHCLVRASEPGKSVTALGAQTPFDPELLRYLHHILVVQRRAELVDLAARLGDALGPGFYGHDLLFEKGSGRILVCESGLKFDSLENRRNWLAIAAYLPESEMVFSPRQPARSAGAFLAECRRHGRFADATREVGRGAKAAGDGTPEVIATAPLAAGRDSEGHPA